MAAAPPAHLQFSVYDQMDQRLERELAVVTREAKRKRDDVDAWQRTQEQAIRERHEKRSRMGGGDARPAWIYHVYKDNQFAVRDGDSACSSIAVVAAYNFLKRARGKTPTRINWTRVVHFGVDLWRYWYRETTAAAAASASAHAPDRHQSPWDVYNLSPVKQIRATMCLLGEHGGDLDDAKALDYAMPDPRSVAAGAATDADAPSFLTLADAVALLAAGRASDRRRAATFTVHDGTVCLLYNDDDGGGDGSGGRWYVFDSHGGVRHGHSTLVECQDARTLCDYLREKYPVDAQQGPRWLNARSRPAPRRRRDPNTFSFTLFAPSQSADDVGGAANEAHQ